jgi:hypothetical protein
MLVQLNERNIGIAWCNEYLTRMRYCSLLLRYDKNERCTPKSAYKCDLCDFTYFTDLDIHLLNILDYYN